MTLKSIEKKRVPNRHDSLKIGATILTSRSNISFRIL